MTRMSKPTPRVITEAETVLIGLLETHVRPAVSADVWNQLHDGIGLFGRGEYGRGYLLGAKEAR